MCNEKIVIKKEQAEAISELLQLKRKDLIIKQHLSGPGDWIAEYDSLNWMVTETLIKALYIGYEVVKTPEEKLIDYYKELNLNEDSSADIAFGIIKTLKILGIKVEGIN